MKPEPEIDKNGVECKSCAGLKRTLIALMVMIILITGFAGTWIVLKYQEFLVQPLVLPGNGMDYAIPAGTSLRGVAGDLHRLGVTQHPHFLIWLGRRTKLDSRLQAGEYRIAFGTTPPQLLEQFASGIVVQYSQTIVEGWNFREMLRYVQDNPALTGTLEGIEAAEIMERLGYPGIHPEGRFFPDTYHFPKGTTDIEFLQRAYRTMERHLEEEWQNREEGLPLKNAEEALILASIVEKETGVADERGQIAGVFIRRLNRKMRLQTDPTVIYGMGENFDGNIRRKDLRTDTPYNTYTRDGLPPTPIAMPGLDAIRAVLHPKEGKALYFVAKGDGSHQFSATLKEHNRAVRKYQLGGKGN